MFRNKYTRMTLSEKRKLYKCGDSYVRLANIPVWPVLYRKVKGPPYSLPRKERTPTPQDDMRQDTHVKETSQDTTLPVSPAQDGEVNKDEIEIDEIEVVRTKPSREKIEVNNEINYKVSLWNGDITTLEIDAIIRGTDKTLREKLGAHAEIHKSAGPTLMKDVNALNGCETGEAKITSGHKLPAKYIIHTVGPFFGQDKSNLLQTCYENCLDLILEYNIRSVAFPCVATGLYGYPNREAAEIALRTIRRWLLRHGDKIERVIFCTFLSRDFQIYQRLMTTKYFPCECIYKELYNKSTIKNEDNDNEPGKPDGEKFGNTQSNGKKMNKYIHSNGGHQYREKSGTKGINGKTGKSVNGERRNRRLVKSSLSKSMINLSQISKSVDFNDKPISKTDDYIGRRSGVNKNNNSNGYAGRRPKTEIRTNNLQGNYKNESRVTTNGEMSNLDELMSQISYPSSRGSTDSSNVKGEVNGSAGDVMCKLDRLESKVKYTSIRGSRESSGTGGEINTTSDGGIPKLDELMSQINDASSRGSSDSSGANGEANGTSGGEMCKFDGLESKVNYTSSRGSQEDSGTKGEINIKSDGGISKFDELMSQISYSRGLNEDNAAKCEVNVISDGEICKLDGVETKTSRGLKGNNYMKGEINVITDGGISKLDELMSQITRESNESSGIKGEINVFSNGEICNPDTIMPNINYPSIRGSSEGCDIKGEANGTPYSGISKADDPESKINNTSGRGSKESSDIKNKVNGSDGEILKVDGSGRKIGEISGKMCALDDSESKENATSTSESRDNSYIKGETNVTSDVGMRKLDELKSNINSTSGRGTSENNSVKKETNGTSDGGSDQLGNHKTNVSYNSNNVSSDFKGNVVLKVLNGSCVGGMDKPNTIDSKTNTTSNGKSSEGNVVESKIIDTSHSGIGTSAAIVCKVNDTSTPKAYEDGDTKINVSGTIYDVESKINNSSNHTPIENSNIADNINIAPNSGIGKPKIDNIPKISSSSDTKKETSSITSSYQTGYSYSGNDINTTSYRSRFGYCGTSSTSSFSDRFGLGSSTGISSKLDDRTWERVGATAGVVDRFDSYKGRYQHSGRIRAIIDKYSDSYKI